MAQDSGNGLALRILSIVVNHEPAVLARIVGLFAGRGWNIDSLTVSSIMSYEFREYGKVARITLGITDSIEHTEHVQEKIRSLPPVLKVEDITNRPDLVTADVTVIKVACASRQDVEGISLRATTNYRALVILDRGNCLTIRFVGPWGAAQDLVKMIQTYPEVQIETAHSGIIAIA